MKIGKSSCKEMLLNIKKQPKEHFNAVHRKNIIINLQGKFFYYKLTLVVSYCFNQVRLYRKLSRIAKYKLRMQPCLSLY